MVRRLVSILGILLMTLMAMIVAAGLFGAGYQAYATHRDEQRFPPPGRLLDVGTHRLHVDCRGEGSPMILLDSGGQLWSSGWRHVHADLARDHRVCAYDRSGLGWSDAGPPPYDAVHAVAELHTLIGAAGEASPFVFVGHSLGGMLARVYHRRYPDDLLAAVYIDVGEPEILIEDFGAARDDPIRACGVSCRTQIGLAYVGVPRLVLANVDMLDDPALPADAVAEFRALASRPRFLKTAFMVARYTPPSVYQTLDAGHIDDLPVLVLWSGDYGELVSAGETAEDMQRWRAAYLARWTYAAETSPDGVGPIEIEGANHITVIAARHHAARVSDEIRRFVGDRF